MCYNTLYNTGLNMRKGDRMTTYAQSQMVGSTELAKGLGGFLDKVVSGEISKLAVIRHNKPEAVIIPIGTYEKMEYLYQLAEDIEISEMLKTRMPDGTKVKTIPFEEILDELRGEGIDV